MGDQIRLADWSCSLKTKRCSPQSLFPTIKARMLLGNSELLYVFDWVSFRAISVVGMSIFGTFILNLSLKYTPVKIGKIWVNVPEIYGPNYINVPEIYDLKNRQMWKNKPHMIHSTTNCVSITFLLIFIMVQYWSKTFMLIEKYNERHTYKTSRLSLHIASTNATSLRCTLADAWGRMFA